MAQFEIRVVSDLKSEPADPLTAKTQLRSNYLVPKAAVASRAQILKGCVVDKAPDYATKRVQKIKCYKEHDSCFVVPRHYGLRLWGPPDSERDHSTLCDVDFPRFKGEMRDYQRSATRACIQWLTKKRGGILQAPCGSGKTCMALKIIEQLGQRALIVVHKSILLYQWEDRIRKFFGDIPVGIIQGTKSVRKRKRKRKKRTEGPPLIYVAMAQTLHKLKLEELPAVFGILIFDECHHVPATTFCKAVKACPARFRLGLTATPRRRDGLIRILHMHLGPVIVAVGEAKIESTTRRGYAATLRSTTRLKNPDNFSMVVNDLVSNSGRTRKIAEAAQTIAKVARKVLVLSGRIKQIHELHEIIGGDLGGVVVGSTTAKKRPGIIRKSKILICSYGVATEGFDCPELDAVVFATPCGSGGNALEQAVGRIMRDFDKVRLKYIVDVDDWDAGGFGMLNCLTKKRLRYFVDVLKFELRKM